ncbi:hypothetical protein SADUNF_Sadunf17G0013000 [Salix dunnii]|uniref:Uncharacterized protein n=1 Tax=Salix dunnii TaxID=1413687 RepID=A0A835J4L0_9ROSI|nr:hypothetical protein SADUNF_Sadunf17G0013000 [Salix dunnii]
MGGLPWQRRGRETGGIDNRREMFMWGGRELGQKGTKHKTRQAKALENARKAPRYFLELLYEMEALFSAHVHLFHLIQSDVQGLVIVDEAYTTNVT